jgi:hypothetical protein
MNDPGLEFLKTIVNHPGWYFGNATPEHWKAYDEQQRQKRENNKNCNPVRPAIKENIEIKE